MKPVKKIVYLITKSNWGGAQKYVYELAIAAKDAGHAVSVACGGTGEAGAAAGRLVSELRAADIQVHEIRNFMRDMSLLRDVKALFEVWLLLRRERPDVLHCSSSKAGGVGALAGRLAGVKRIVFTSHGLTIDETWRPLWQRWLIYTGTWLTLKLAHHSIMINTDTHERARHMPGMKDRVSLIMNGIAPIEFLERGAARAKLAPHLPADTLWIGGIGELHPNKNWSTAISALRALPETAHLFIMGEGEERKKLTDLTVQTQLQGRVHLLGHVVAAPSYLSAFDIFVLPSQKEGLPYVLLEAGLAGLPVVASDLSGNRDIIETGETGLLVSLNPMEFSASLQILIRDEGMRRRLGQALHKTVATTFSIERMRNETFALYETSRSSAR